jgi:uncharacterized RDD family membrane protein YckC
MSHNQYAPPQAEVDSLRTDPVPLEYVGFWLRVGAALIDTVLIMACTLPLMVALYGWAYFDPPANSFARGPAEVLVSWVLPAVAAVMFWVLKQATPGKMAVGAKIVDARTGAGVSTGQAVGRYLAYFVSMLPVGLGLVWVAFDSKKRGWHDMLAGTVVVRSR